MTVTTARCADVEAILARVVGAGLRRTPACRAVVDVLAQTTNLTVAQAHQHLADHGVNIELSTAHRLLRRLERAGVVQAMPVAGAIRYMLVDSPQHYLTCRRCEGLTPIPPTVVDNVLRYARTVGFALGRGGLLISGLCAGCLG